MNDGYCQSYLHRLRGRHTADSPLVLALEGISWTVERARSLHKEKGAGSHGVIRSELMPQFARHMQVIESNIKTASSPALRDDYAGAYGVTLVCRDTLTGLARLSPSDWHQAQSDAKHGVAA